ncbi:hypothetical protein ACPCTK_05370 [Streptomyces pseudogriseolus]|uniref:hypothetical protein n=1 Tax=Streptomyces pseudogriseolus TaxID=36817 RepID=UPI003FA2305A
MGRSALDTVVAQAGSKPLSFTLRGRQADSVGVQPQVAEAALQLETARLPPVRRRRRSGPVGRPRVHSTTPPAPGFGRRQVTRLSRCSRRSRPC